MTTQHNYVDEWKYQVGEDGYKKWKSAEAIMTDNGQTLLILGREVMQR
jgi:hypothetical protein